MTPEEEKDWLSEVSDFRQSLIEPVFNSRHVYSSSDLANDLKIGWNFSAIEKEEEMHKLSPKTLQGHLEVWGEIIDALRRNDDTFRIDGTPSVTVKLKDDTFRRKVLKPKTDFILIDARIGQRENILLEFEPLENIPEIKSVETSLKEADQIFPLLGLTILDCFGCENPDDESLWGAFEYALREKQEREKKEEELAEQEVIKNANWARF